MSATSPQAPVLEVLTDSVRSALAAQAGGAGRLELCANLLEGGTTPSAGMIAGVRAASSLPLHVMIRPRGADFLYDEHEFAVMERDIALARDLGADGVVLGLLRADGTVDVERTRRLVESARPLRVTFHRAFDMTRSAVEALEDVVVTGADLLLTSGQEASALDGAPLIAELVQRAGDRLTVMPGAGITEGNIARIRTLTGARELHVDARVTARSAMAHRNDECFMGGTLRPPDYAWETVDSSRTRALREAAFR